MENINKFQNKVHFWGRITLLLALVLSVGIPSYLTFVLGYTPRPADIISGIVAILGFVGMVWILEPISYYPTLGSAGTYLSFLSGNIGNMRLPVITATQDALDLEPGSEKAEIAGIFSLVASIVANLAILVLVMVAGQAIIKALPPVLLKAFNYALPGILGAMLVMLSSKISAKHKIGLLTLSLAFLLFIRFSPNFMPKRISTLITLGNSGIVAIFGIFYALIFAKKDSQVV